MAHKTVADLIVESLQAAGVKHCWGVPGDTLNYVTDAIRRSDIQWVHVRHEEVGGFAAGAEALLSDDLTACAGSCGPGSLHFINGLFESHRNRAPVVLIASQITTDERDFDFPQEVDFESIYRSCSVFCSEIRSPDQARRKTAMAAQAALAKRGVAVLILPVDISKAPAPNEPAFGSLTSTAAKFRSRHIAPIHQGRPLSSMPAPTRRYSTDLDGRRSAARSEAAVARGLPDPLIPQPNSAGDTHVVGLDLYILR
jgi:thiamine pyrophosphate-dependent acetolactate synthase large subunit-like protein